MVGPFNFPVDFYFQLKEAAPGKSHDTPAGICGKNSKTAGSVSLQPQKQALSSTSFVENVTYEDDLSDFERELCRIPGQKSYGHPVGAGHKTGYGEGKGVDVV